METWSPQRAVSYAKIWGLLLTDVCGGRKSEIPVVSIPVLIFFIVTLLHVLEINPLSLQFVLRRR